jgi:hypothetical protein
MSMPLTTDLSLVPRAPPKPTILRAWLVHRSFVVQRTSVVIIASAQNLAPHSAPLQLVDRTLRTLSRHLAGRNQLLSSETLPSSPPKLRMWMMCVLSLPFDPF